MKTELLRIDNGKQKMSSFGSLCGVYISLMAGETLGIVFANLHEKLTFIQALRADPPFQQGRIYLNEKISPNPNALRDGVHVINKASALMSQLSIWENVYYASIPPFVFQKNSYREMLLDAMDEIGITISPDTPVTQLSHAEAIQIELLKAYVMKRRVIVLADISYYLTVVEMQEMFVLIQKMKKHGFGFILIDSARDLLIENVNQFCFVTHGRTSGFFSPDEVRGEAFDRILWQGIDVPTGDESVAISKSSSNATALSFEHVETPVLEDVSFALNRGEFLKIIYMEEKDGDALISLLRGEQTALRGKITLAGKRFHRHGVCGAQRQGMCVMEDNPTENLLIPQLSVMDNLGLSMWRKSPLLWFHKANQTSLHQTLSKLCNEDLWELSIDSLTPVQAQKLVYAKWILYNPKVVVCVNPFTGMDYQVDSVTENMLQRMLAKGIAVLIVASYMPALTTEGATLFLRDGRLTAKESKV